MKKHATRLGLLLALATLLGGAAFAIPWPYMPFDQTHGLGNHYDEYQNYGGSPYYHDGIDLVTPSGPTRTYSVHTATVTHLTYSDPLYSGIMIGEPFSGGIGWLYWHINSTTFQYDIGDPVEVNAYIGTTANWPVAAFHHTHFNKVQGTEGYPWGWYISTDNPLLYLEPNTDPDAPVFEAAYQGKKFGFRRNQETTVLDANALTGDVDVIARISDIVGMPEWKLNPWRIDYWIDGATQSVPPINFVDFSGLTPHDGTVGVVYSTNSPFGSRGNYDSRIYYFIVTNTDGDGLIELTDSPMTWQTGNYRPGDYWVYVRAADIGGNVVTDSMMCTVAGPINVHVVVPETAHDYGGVPPLETATWSMHIQNTGLDWLSVRDIASDNPVFRPLTRHLYVPPSGDVAVDVAFTPEGVQEYTGTLTITSNDLLVPVINVSLRGRGLDPAGVADGAEAPAAFGIAGTRALPQGGIEVRYGLDRAGGAAFQVYDVAGRIVRSAEVADGGAGIRSWSWDGRNGSGDRMSSGIYYVRMTSGGRSSSAHCVLIR